MKGSLWLLWSLTLALAGCVSMLTLPRDAFVTSSLDKNKGRYHRLELAGDVAQVSGRLIGLAKERGMVLVQQRRNAARVDLAFRSKPIDRRVFKGTTSRHLSYYSRYFFRLEGTGAKVEVLGVGLPVLDGRMSCPAGAKPLAECRVEKLTHKRGKTLGASVRAEWGYDISGKNEAEALAGMLAELPNAAATTRAAATPQVVSAPSPKGMIVAVFEIEDRVGLLSTKTRAQLTEYLAAGVTRFAGYQVIPHEELRRRLAAEKRKSYKLCVEQRCQIELGKALAAKKSLATKLLKVGKQCAFTALLYDLRTEATERAAQVRTACDQDALLGGVEKLAKQLAGVK